MSSLNLDEKLSVQYGGKNYEIDFMSAEDALAFQKFCTDSENDEQKILEKSFDLLCDYGLPREIVKKLSPRHLRAVISALVGDVEDDKKK